MVIESREEDIRSIVESIAYYKFVLMEILLRQIRMKNNLILNYIILLVFIST